jgi:hypothetical protein
MDRIAFLDQLHIFILQYTQADLCHVKQRFNLAWT